MNDDNTDITKCSPNAIVWKLFENLQLIEKAAGTPIYEQTIPNYSMMSVFMAVACIETFLNLYFRQLVEFPKYSNMKEEVLKQIKYGLEQKLKELPRLFFGKNLLESIAGINFHEYRNIRNGILHYKHTCEELVWTGFKITGLTDSTIIHNLDAKYIWESKRVVRELISEILIYSGCNPE